jgi:hypothetical protein
LIFSGHHSTSGASEMIFMWFLARSSRGTGPKIRVPIGSAWVDQHGRVAVETDGRAIGATDVLGGANDDGLHARHPSSRGRAEWLP